MFNHTPHAPLSQYVIAVIIAWVAMLIATRFGSSQVRFHNMLILAAGFFLGMIAMYIAVHLYVWT